MITATSLLGNSQKLDGGAMFGNAPKALWSKWAPADDRNRIDLACRCLLIELADQKILLEAGIGNFFPAAMRERYGIVEDHHVLLQSLKNHGVDPQEITDVILSHLHFDHIGGLLYEGKLLFDQATYHIGKKALDRAKHPHLRDKASFLEELVHPLLAHNKINVIENCRTDRLPPIFSFHESDGHTPGLLLTDIRGNKTRIVFAADLIPGTAWIHLPMSMGYDRYPELLIDEKTALISELSGNPNSYLFFTHDPIYAMTAIVKNEKGQYCPDKPIHTFHRLLI